MQPRRGATLLEVLVAIFIMGIGLLALLTLFPIGALRMAKAIQDENCFQCGTNASGIGIMSSVAQNQALLTPDAYLNPLPVAFPNAHPDFPSYPVFVDGFGALTFPNPPLVIASPFPSAIARRTLDYIITAPNAAAASRLTFQAFSRQDDIDFENAPPVPAPYSPPGTPRLIQPPPGGLEARGTFSRDTRYTYAYMVQRPRYVDATVIDTTIVVYNRRPLTLTSTLSAPEYAYTNNNTFVDLNANTIQVDYTNNVPPPVRVGDWLLDATSAAFVAPDGRPSGTAHGNFYRVVGTNDLGNNQIEYEVEQSIRGFPMPGTAPNAARQYLATIIVLDGVAEVYTKGTSR